MSFHSSAGLLLKEGAFGCPLTQLFEITAGTREARRKAESRPEDVNEKKDV